MSKYIYIRASEIRKLAKASGKRCGSDFLATLDKFVYEKILHCIKERNGGHKTLDENLIYLTK